jgi:hypothetical protein
VVGFFGFASAGFCIVVSALDGIAGRRTTGTVLGAFDFDGALASVAGFVFGLVFMPFFVSAVMVFSLTTASP